MDTYFLFSRHLDDTGCICLKLNKEGKLLSAPIVQSFAQIKELQQDCKTLIVETTENTTLFDLELPWLSEMKARVTIPYALEDKLAQPIEDLHFAFDKQRYNNKHYLITVISKARIQYLMQKLMEHGIEYETITTDWFALSSPEMASTGSTLLVSSDDFKGALSGELALNYLKTHSALPTLIFSDNQFNTSLPIIEEHSYVWIAQNISKSKPLNLCQGSMQHGNASDWIKKGYQLSVALFGVWLLVLLVVNGINLYVLNKKTAGLDKQIETIYFQFFPEAHQVISPKFRISQLLGNNNVAGGQAHIWFLLRQFTQGMKGQPATIEQLRFQNKTLSVTLISDDFASLERLENQLKQLQLKVKQTQATTRESHVVATLELS